MTPNSDSLDDLTRDLRNLATLIGVITTLAIDIIDPDRTQCDETKRELTKVTDLLWVSRDMVETIANNSDAAHLRVIAERNAARKTADGKVRA